MPRRLEHGLAALASAALSALVIWPALADWGQRLPGGWASWGQGWAMARLRWALTGQDAPSIDGPVVLAGWPQLLLGAGSFELLGPAASLTLVTWLWLAAGVFAVFVVARSLGAGRLSASLAAVAGGLNPVVVHAVHQGWLEWLAVPLIALAFWGATRDAQGRSGLLGGLLGGLAAGLTALCTPALGVATAALAVWAAVARGWSRVLAVGAPAMGGAVLVGWGYRDGAAMPRPVIEKIVAYVDPLDLLAPVWVWRDWGLHAGLLAWLALAAVALLVWRREGPLLGAFGGAAALGALLSFGPMLQWGGARVSPGGVIVPLPALIVEQLMSPGVLINWKVALVPALVAAALLLSRVSWPRLAAPALALLLVELAWAGPCPTVDGAVPHAIRQLAEGEGVVLQLPVELAAAEGDDGLALKALYWQGVHRRPLLTGMGPLWQSRLLSEPLMVLAANAQVGEDRWAVPPAGPVSVLRELDVVEVILDRSQTDTGTLALLDRLLAKAMESPQRDLAGGVDVFAVPVAARQSLPIEPRPLTPVTDIPPGWSPAAEYLGRWR